MTLLTSSAQGFEAKSSLNKQESCNDYTSANPAFGLGTKTVRARAGEGERAVCHLLPPLGAGEPRSRLLSGAHTIWPAVSVGRCMKERGCFSAPTTVKENKIHCSQQGRKLSFSFSKGCFPSEIYSSIRRHGGSGSTCPIAMVHSHNGCTPNWQCSRY